VGEFRAIALEPLLSAQRQPPATMRIHRRSHFAPAPHFAQNADSGHPLGFVVCLVGVGSERLPLPQSQPE
jgi:hypothetical protein